MLTPKPKPLEILKKNAWHKVSDTEYRKGRMRARMFQGKVILEHRWNDRYRRVQVCNVDEVKIIEESTFFITVRAEDPNLKTWRPPRPPVPSERTLVTFNYNEGLEKAKINPYDKPWLSLRPKYDGKSVTMRAPKALIQLLDEKEVEYTKTLSTKS